MGVAASGCSTPRSAVRGPPAAGLLAGAVLALTPVAALMFRFNNPDALLVLLLVAGGVRDRAGDRGRRRHPVRWLALAGALVGLGFLTKMLQALLVLPGVRAGLPGRRPAAACCKRVGHLLVAFGSMIAGGRLVDRDRRAVAGRRAGPTSAARRTTASSS